jgi:hypothetical protein
MQVNPLSTPVQNHMRHQSGSSASLHTIKLLVVPFIIGVNIGSVRAQNPVTAFPKNYAVGLENGDVSVLRVHYGPVNPLGYMTIPSFRRPMSERFWSDSLRSR